MKRIKYIVLYTLLAAAGLFSCEEDDNKVTFAGGDAPVLSVSSTDDIVLTKSQEAFSSLQFQWTNPNYKFSNGVNTQDVNYTLEIDTTGSDFSSPKIVELTFTNDVARSFKVKDLNTVLSGLELSDYKPHNFEFRVKAALASNSVPQYSNVVKVKISTYLDVVYPVPAKLFITGAATPKDWMGPGDPEPATQTFKKVNAYQFVLEGLQINGGSAFLFVPVYGNWDNKYGFTGEKEKNNQSGDTFKPGGENFLSPAAGKKYKITVNFKTGKYSFE